MAEDKDKIKNLLNQVVQHCEHEDRASRERQIRTWRRLKLLWDGYSRTWYSETAHDWRVWDEQQDTNTDQEYYDKPVNIFRAYLESIIAALSVAIPNVICYPDNADDALDIATAKAGNKISQIIYRHNDISLFWLHALFCYVTEGMIACYHRPECHKDYGMYEEAQFEDVTEKHQTITCPQCQFVFGDNVLSDNAKPEKPVEDECPQCGYVGKPNSEVSDVTTQKFVGSLNKEKSRVLMEVFGGLNIKVPNWARFQSEVPYLIYAYETHFANAIEKFKDVRDDPDIRRMINQKSAGAYDQYDQWGRLSPQYQGEYPINVVTVKYAWLRPSIFNVIKDDDDVKFLCKKFPNGAKVSLVNTIVVDWCDKCLDDDWSIIYNPTANYLQADPIALMLTSIQDMVNDIVSLTVQTIEHGIGQSFADPAVLSFAQYEQNETIPGAIYPIKQGSLGGKAISDAFYEMRTATLSAEVLPFLENVQTMGQTVIGALPSLWGGQIQGSKTASVYSMSRSQALQRLGNTWKMFLAWWEVINNKIIPMYINEMKQDEHEVQKTKDGNFINTFITMSELEGKIGRVELEANENLPITWNQVRDTVMQLLQSSNPKIMEIFGSSENLELIREAIGLTDIYVPGEDDRNKQYEEIKTLLNSAPLTDSEPSVEIDPTYDNHMIEFEIVRKWVTSEEGRAAKITNPDGYKNVLLHGLKHQQEIQQSMQPPPPASGNNPSGPPAPGDNTPFAKPNPLNQEAPIMGDRNVSTVQ